MHKKKSKFWELCDKKKKKTHTLKLSEQFLYN